MPGMPSCSVIWLALSRPRYDGWPPVSAPAWALPISGSPLGAAAAEVVDLQVVVLLGEAQVVGVVVHPVVRDEQVRHRRRRCRCRPGRSCAGSHLELFQASVNACGVLAGRRDRRLAVPPGVSGLTHASWVLALLPTRGQRRRRRSRRWCPTGRARRRCGAARSARCSPAPGIQQPTTEFVGVVGLPT